MTDKGNVSILIKHGFRVDETADNTYWIKFIHPNSNTAYFNERGTDKIKYSNNGDKKRYSLTQITFEKYMENFYD